MTLPDLTHLVSQHGALVFLLLGFLEYIGAPIVTVPALIVGGALARIAGGIHPGVIVLAAATGGLAADAVLYFVTRYKGDQVVDAACGLTSNPKACVLSVIRKLEVLGGRYIVIAKLVPGAGNLIAPASALAGVPARHFLSRDALALLIWASVYTTMGWTFAEHVESMLSWVVTSLDLVVAVGATLIVGAGVWRLVRTRLHSKGHERAREHATGAQQAPRWPG